MSDWLLQSEAERLLAGARDLEESIGVSLSARRFEVGSRLWWEGLDQEEGRACCGNVGSAPHPWLCSMRMFSFSSPLPASRPATFPLPVWPASTAGSSSRPQPNICHLPAPAALLPTPGSPLSQAPAVLPIPTPGRDRPACRSTGWSCCCPSLRLRRRWAPWWPPSSA
jgi:hypothetical protein